MRRHPRGDSSVRSSAATPAEIPAPSTSPWHFVLVCSVAVVLCAVLKLPALLYPPAEADERIYWQLAETLASRGEYTLRGSPLLASLSSHVYDRPVFHHPPLFAASLVPFVRADAQRGAVLIPWTGHFLAIFAVALIARHVATRQGAVDYLAPRFWLPVLGIATDPLLTFVSRRLWIDSLLAGLVAMACAAIVLAEGRNRRRWIAAAGVLLGLAGLAKLTALILLPVLMFFALRADSTWSERLRSAAGLIVPVLVLLIPWFVLFYQQTGVLVPSWVKPDAALMEMYPFLRTAVERPWHYYVTTLLAIAPVVALAGWAAASDRNLWKEPAFQLAAAWFLVYVIAQTILGVDGYGFQMRHVAPAAAAIYVVLLIALLRRPSPVILFLSSVAILVGTVTGAMHLLVPELDELLTLKTIGGLTLF